MFRHDGKVHYDVFVISQEKFLNFTSSKFEPNKESLLQSGKKMIHWLLDLKDISNEVIVLKSLTYKEQRAWNLVMKSWNNKVKMLLENLA